MYATLVMFNIGPGMQEQATGMADQFAQLHATLKGFKSSTFFSDEAKGDYGAFSLWETNEDAEAALGTAGPKLQEALKDIVQEPPTVRIFEVYLPNM
ncbi:antibiotic biosynthesis monooxygenase family protein [Dethiobacter alkaliphilus]|uniref:ABM domain-containing protein n=1 Tax=Dethiobacter alkaliphilus AHT 1 TaxID=555088 RepID=C0GFE6_DETAL|nr:hypothetical protein [Dethiobacter alkaliphilus]EEG77906.1 hypothetical protein DealDRAFT_1205 [Dethiobacter alkaliphilus AHT 1]